jgi:hypothetical protein
MSLTINGGTTINGGFTLTSQPIIPLSASFTISDIGDFTASAYQGPGITDFGGSIGLLSDGSQTADVAQYGIALNNFTSPKLAEIQAYFFTNMLVNNGTYGYNFTVAGTGGASNITKAIIGLDGANFIIAPVGAAGLTNFATNTSPMNTIVNANGILAFPVTFTLDSPLILHPGSWY